MFTFCKKCITFEKSDSSKYCIVCGKDIPYHKIVNEDWKDDHKTIPYEKVYQTYHDLNKYNESLIYTLTNHIQGIEITWYIPLKIKILQEIPNPCNWKNIWDVYKKYGMEQIWRGFWYTITECKELPGPSKKDYDLIMSILWNLPNLYKQYNWTGTKKLSFFYLLYKFRRTRRESTIWIPLKTTNAKLKEYEIKYKDICKHYNLFWEPLQTYIINTITKTGKTKKKTMYGIPPFKWDKDNIIKQMKLNWTNKSKNLKILDKQMWTQVYWKTGKNSLCFLSDYVDVMKF
jgi:hypothetical protein